MTTRAKLFWVGVLYFAEGFPFGLLIDTFPVYFRFHGVSLAQIGLLNVVGLAWMLKWIWAPAVDLWGQYRTWIVWCQAARSEEHTSELQSQSNLVCRLL